jgi:hypothetical protein
MRACATLLDSAPFLPDAGESPGACFRSACPWCASAIARAARAHTVLGEPTRFAPEASPLGRGTLEGEWPESPFAVAADVWQAVAPPRAPPAQGVPGPHGARHMHVSPAALGIDVASRTDQRHTRRSIVSRLTEIGRSHDTPRAACAVHEGSLTVKPSGWYQTDFGARKTCLR